MSEIKSKLEKKYLAVGNNILLSKTEVIKTAGPQKTADGLVTITSQAETGVSDKEYKVVSVGGNNTDRIKVNSLVLLHPSARGGIEVDSEIEDKNKFRIVNVTLNDILAIVS
jgi:hypothetical protein